MNNTEIVITRGDNSPLVLEMSDIYRAENRLYEVASINAAAAPELIATFNVACNTTAKYLAWLEYEFLKLEKQYSLAKAEVILDKLPEAVKSMKDSGIKNNEDFREALIIRDPECSQLLDKINTIKGVKALLEAKSWSFLRAYNSCRDIWNKKETFNPNLSDNFTQNEYQDKSTLDTSSFIGKARF